MRLAILVIAGLDLLLLAAGLLRLWLGGVKSDAAGQGMAQAYAIIGALIAVLLLTPALLLAWHQRLLWLALLLALLASIGVLAVLVSG